MISRGRVRPETTTTAGAGLLRRTRPAPIRRSARAAAGSGRKKTVNSLTFPSGPNRSRSTPSICWSSMRACQARNPVEPSHAWSV